jgi:hypothetical protein
MSDPAWPGGVPLKPLVDGFVWEPYGEPDVTEMDRGNRRQRQYPGINICRTTFTIMVTKAEFSTFRTWLIDTVFRGSKIFTADVYNGTTTLVGKRCQIIAKPKYGFPEPKRSIALEMLVYDAE